MPTEPDYYDLTEALIDAWQAQDIEQTIALMRDDVVFRLNRETGDGRFAAEIAGKSNVRALMEYMAEKWEYLAYDQQLLSVDGTVARVQTTYEFLHRASQLRLGGSKRMIVRFRDGLVAEIDQLEDAQRIEAFLRLAAEHIREMSEQE